MPKLTLKFDTIEEREEYENAVNGHKYRFILSEFDGHLRSIVKYGEVGGKEFTEKEQDLVDKLRQELWDLINDEHVEV